MWELFQAQFNEFLTPTADGLPELAGLLPALAKLGQKLRDIKDKAATASTAEQPANKKPKTSTGNERGDTRFDDSEGSAMEEGGELLEEPVEEKTGGWQGQVQENSCSR